MCFGILGPLDVRTGDGTPLDPGGPRPRTPLTLLLLDAGRPVSTQRLTDGLDAHQFETWSAAGRAALAERRTAAGTGCTGCSPPGRRPGSSRG
ncbi:hypothetical protein [Streptomyces sp. NPDC086777]|uniref:hypothetical protein n=1 Tax=Streptomyces sp. NPDC086777 TaxID=3154866 RepID=UPI00344E48C8